MGKKTKGGGMKKERHFTKIKAEKLIQYSDVFTVKLPWS